LQVAKSSALLEWVVRHQFRTISLPRLLSMRWN